VAESHGDAKGTAAHTEADGGHKAPFPPFQKDTFASQLVSLVIAFAALYLIVSRIALPRVGSVIDQRQNTIDGDLADAQKLKDQSDSALKAYENELAAARSRAQAIGAETREKQNAASEAERKTLEEQLSVKLAEAEKTIASTRETAMGNVRGIAADAAGPAAHRPAAGRQVGRQRRRCVLEGITPMFSEPEFWVAVAFVILIGVFVYYGIHRTVLKTLDHRSDRIKAELDDARRLKDEAAKLLAEYQARHASAEREARDIIESAKAEAERMASEAKAKMEDFVARRTKTAESKIALAEAQAVADVRSAAANAAVTAASTILSQSVKGAIDDDLLAKGIAEVRQKLN
jgi:F-type H+-transporting ATPase subunit b